MGGGELRMLTRVARMYHEERLPQREIAARLSLSQSRVSRMLRRASETGIVRTVVDRSRRRSTPTSRTSCVPAYSLRDVVVVDDASLPALGAADRRLSGRHGGRRRADRDRLLERDADGRRTTRCPAPVASQAEEVTQLVGGIGDPAVQFRATGLTARLAELTGARAVPLPAPGLLRSVALRDALVLDPAVAGVMDGWDELTLALVGIGALEPSALLEQSGNAICDFRFERPARTGRGRRHLLSLLRRERARAVDSPLDARVLGIAPERLHAIGSAGRRRGRHPQVPGRARRSARRLDQRPDHRRRERAPARRGEPLTMLPSFRLEDQVALVTGAGAASVARSRSGWPPPAPTSPASICPVRRSTRFATISRR